MGAGVSFYRATRKGNCLDFCNISAVCVADGFVLTATAMEPSASFTHVRFALVDYPQCTVLDSRGMPLAPFIHELDC